MKKQMILWVIIAFFTLQLIPAQERQNAPLMRNEQVLRDEQQNPHKSDKTALDIDLTYVNSILWTQVRDVKVSGNYAYCAFTNGIVILDITNKSSPVFVSRLYLEGGGTASALSIDNNYAYIACGTSGLQIINVSNPALPVLAGSYDTPDWAYGVAVSGGYAYVADYSSGLQIINVSNPASPALAGSYNTPGNTEVVAVSGAYAYVADYYSLMILKSTVTSVDDETPVKGKIPNQFKLMQNYPNPFNPVTVIRFEIPKASEVRITVYNILGEKVKTLVSGYLSAGSSSVKWDGTNDKGEQVSSGIYVYQMIAGNSIIIRRMILIK